MRILAIGDIIGKPGRRAVDIILHDLRQQHQLDMVIANGENTAGGVGVTYLTAKELLDNGVDVITTGNHVWAHRDILEHLDTDMPILRPLNYPHGVQGRGYLVRNNVMVVNLMGRTFIGNFDCPFQSIDKLLNTTASKAKVIIVDFHAEATSEKMAMGRYLDGRVSAVLGTHTHVGTIDHQIFPNGTAYVTDIGMTGPIDSIIGDKVDLVISRFLTAIPHRLSVGEGRCVFNAILVDIDENSGKARSIERIQREVA